jgi:hypothetical protein
MAASTVAIVSSCPVCIPHAVIDIFTETAKFAAKLALDISEQVYAEIVDSQDDEAAAEQDSAVYQNVISMHGNAIQTHNLLEQVQGLVCKALVGLNCATKKVSVRRRLQVIDCTNTTLSGYVDNCSKPSCENPTKLCDGSFNYQYISQLAGGEYHKEQCGIYVFCHVQLILNCPICFFLSWL